MVNMISFLSIVIYNFTGLNFTSGNFILTEAFESALLPHWAWRLVTVGTAGKNGSMSNRGNWKRILRLQYFLLIVYTVEMRKDYHGTFRHTSQEMEEWSVR
jgi:hypothetical protein